ncbi:hypothetical protein [Gordonia alkaliphila]
MWGTVQSTADGSISWHADTGVALGPILFHSNGIRFIVDAAAPAHIVGLAAVDAAALRARAHWFADAAAVAAIADAADGDRAAAPIAGAALVRQATVCAVDAVHLGDLDEAVLLLDHAHAAAAAGDYQRGAGRYALARVVVERLVEDIEVQDYLGPFNARLLEVVATAPDGVFTDVERGEITDELRGRLERTEAPWQVILGAGLARDELASTLGGGDTAVAESADLGLLPPRLLEFDGPDTPEIAVTPMPDAVHLSAQLRGTVDLDGAEANQVFAVVADRRTGDLLSHAPMRVVGDRLDATVRLHGIDPATVRCGLIGADTALDALRLDDVGAALTGIDRQCRYAWSEHRRAGAMLAATDFSATESQLVEVVDLAAQARKAAEREMRSAVRRVGRLAKAATADTAEGLAAYAAAVGRLAEQISSVPAVDGPDGPILAELHEVALG